MDITRSKDGSVHVTDERIATITAMVGALLSLMGGGLLIGKAIGIGSVWAIIGASVYIFGLLGLFVMSALHHGIHGSKRTNEVFRRLDYASIFLLIAGTTTPIVLMSDRSITAWVGLGVIWGVAALGISLCVSIRRLPKHISNTLFIAMGWLPVLLLAAVPLSLSWAGLILLAAGGIIYSAGFVGYVSERPNLLPGVFGFHELWHCFVLLGAFFHYLFIYIFVIK